MSQSLDFRIRSLQPSDSIAELTAMIRSAYAPHAEKGLRFVGTYQDERTTAERLAAGHGLVAESERGLVGTVVVRTLSQRRVLPCTGTRIHGPSGNLLCCPSGKGAVWGEPFMMRRLTWLGATELEQ